MLSWLREPALDGLPPGTTQFFAAQKALILKRPLLKRCYDDWYGRLLADARSVPTAGELVELGSGGSYLKDLEPAVITSDVSPDIAERVEAFGSRFGRMQDTFAEKLLPRWLLALAEQCREELGDTVLKLEGKGVRPVGMAK